MIALSPDSNLTSSTRALEPDASTRDSDGRADTVPSRPKYGSRMMRTVAFLPQVLSGVIVGFVWRYILAQDGIPEVVPSSV